jgi:hypothetical protein
MVKGVYTDSELSCIVGRFHIDNSNATCLYCVIQITRKPQSNLVSDRGYIYLSS